MYQLSAKLDRFVRFSSFTVREEQRDLIVAKPPDLTMVQEEMLREARLAGLIDEDQTINELYQVFLDAGFHEEIVEDASRRQPMLVREHEKGE